MNKLRTLQFFIYLTFSLLVVHNVLPDLSRGFLNGLRDGRDMAQGTASQIQSIPAVLKGDILSANNSRLKINSDYSLQNIYINADVLLNTERQPDALLTYVSLTLTLGIGIVLILVAYNINNIITSIVHGQIFENKCILYIRRTGWLLLAYATADVIYQRMKISILRDVIHNPLHVCNTTSFNFQVCICAVIAFIAAEAFKYGAQLKEEKELTI